MITLDDNAALVLFSGGQDSATCFAWALERFARVETVGFHLRPAPRHRNGATRADPGSAAARVSGVGPPPRRRSRPAARHARPVSRSALTSDLPAQHRTEGLPATFVPGRNLVFFTFAAIVAYQRNIKNIVTGVCETDYSGYPDCRDDTVKAMQAAVNLGMESRIVFHTPLMWIDKAARGGWRRSSAAAPSSTSSARKPIRATLATAPTSTLGGSAAATATPVGCGLPAGTNSALPESRPA